MQIVGYLLFAIHCALLLWSVGGFLEMILPEVYWKPFTNPAFPNWVLIIHWGSVLFASLGFLLGYHSHWSKTPQIMLIGCGMMSIICAIETFEFMTSSTKYIAHIAILLLLFKAPFFQQFFNQ